MAVFTMYTQSGDVLFTVGVGFSCVCVCVCVQERELAKEMFASAAGQEILRQASKRSNT